MVAGGDRSESPTVQDGERFALRRFAWTAPDRLDVAGTFTALHDAPAADPALVVRGAGGWRHLAAVPEGDTSPPRDGEPWHATFAWQEAPTPFDTAQLAFGDELFVRLPEPTAGGEDDAARVLDVVRVARPAAGEAPGVGAQVEQLRRETELLAAEEQARDLRAAAERTAAELERTRADLEAERQRRAGDAERFQDSLAQVRELAERTVAEAHAEAEAHGRELGEARAALERHEAELGALRQELEGVVAERADLAAEAAHLRERIAALDHVRALAGDARGCAREVLERLDAFVEALDGHAED